LRTQMVSTLNTSPRRSSIAVWKGSTDGLHSLKAPSLRSRSGDANGRRSKVSFPCSGSARVVVLRGVMRCARSAPRNFLARNDAAMRRTNGSPPTGGIQFPGSSGLR
jgi:hypothetical protein